MYRALNNSQVFSQVPSASIQRSKFDMSFSHKTTINPDVLIPVLCKEVLPGDTFTMQMSFFGRLSSSTSVPPLDNLKLRYFAFYVPNRIVWDHWVNFMGEQKDLEDDITEYTVPQIEFTGSLESTNANTNGVLSLADYFGIPVRRSLNPDLSVKVNVLPFRAYAMIWNEWFRDQNLQESIRFSKGDEDITDVENNEDNGTGGLFHIKRISKEHDYFTSALPWPQKGDAITIPVNFVGTSSVVADGSMGFYVSNAFGDVGTSNYALQQSLTDTFDDNSAISVIGVHTDSSVDSSSGSLTLNYGSGLKVDNSTANASVMVNELRTAFQLQHLLERDARGGTRYKELVQSHFGVVVPDYRVQRPEYLGGGVTYIDFSPVPQTSATNDVTPQGNLAAFGTVRGTKNVVSSSFVEHGYIFVLVNLVADTSYAQGLEKHWSRQTRYDFYWPELAHLGEQPILNKEIYYSGDETVDNGVFGYQEKDAEYRYSQNMITGLFRPDVDLNLANWHFGQYFENTPTLQDFVLQSTPIERVLAVTDQPALLLDCYFKINAVRPMPMFSVPGLIDHF